MLRRDTKKKLSTSIWREIWKNPRLFLGLTRFMWRIRKPYVKIVDHDSERIVPPIYRDTFWFLAFTAGFSAIILIVGYLSADSPLARATLAVISTIVLWRVYQRFFESTFMLLTTTEESRELRVLGRLIKLAVHRLLSSSDASAAAGLSEEKRSGLSVVAWITSSPLGQLFIGDFITKLDLITLSLRFLAVLLTLVLTFGLWAWCFDFRDSLAKALLYSLSNLSTVSIGGLTATSMTQMWITAAQVIIQIVTITLFLPMVIPFYERAKNLNRAGSLLGRTLKAEMAKRVSDHESKFGKPRD